MLMLYANRIMKEIYGENEDYLSTENLERITIGKSCIETVATTLNPDFPIVLHVKINKTWCRIELKPNKNFDTITGFFEYTRDYSEIHFETKEIPTKRMIRKGDVYFLKYKKCKQIYYAFYFIYKVVGDDCYHLTYYTDNDEIVFDEHKADYFVNNCEFKERDETGAYYIRTAIDDFLKTCKIILNNKK